MTKALEPPKPKPKTPDISDELSKLYDDGTVLESEKPGALSASKNSLSPRGSQPEIAPPARQNDSQPKYDSQPDSDSLPANLFASLPHAAGFLRLPNTITDNLLRLLTPMRKSFMCSSIVFRMATVSLRVGSVYRNSQSARISR